MDTVGAATLNLDHPMCREFLSLFIGTKWSFLATVYAAFHVRVKSRKIHSYFPKTTIIYMNWILKCSLVLKICVQIHKTRFVFSQSR